MQLREAKIKDLETVVRILDTSRREYLPYAKSPHSLEGFRRWTGGTLIPSGGVVIAQLDGEDVGVIATSVSGKTAWIDQLYVTPGYVGRGIGTELLKHSLDILSRPIRLWAFQENDRAIRYYEYHGFQFIKYTNGENNEEKCPDILYELN